MALPALLAVTVLLVWLIGVAGAHLRCLDAAREGARAMSRGDSAQASSALAAAVAPAGARIAISQTSDMVRVRVQVRVTGGGALARLLPDFTVHASAVSLKEPP